MLFSFSPIENSTCLSSDSVKRLRVYAKRDAHPVLDTLTVPKDPEKANEYIKDYFDNLSFTTYTGEAIDVDYTVKSLTLNNDSTATAVIEVADSQKDEICIARTEDYNKPLSTTEITVPVEYVEKQTISAHWNGGKLKLNLNTFNRDGMMAAIEEKMADDAVSFTDGSGKKIAIPFCGKDGDSGYYIVTTGAGDSMLLTLGFKGKYADFYDLDEGDVAGTVYTGNNFNVLVDFNVYIVPTFIDTDIKVNISKTSTDAEKIAAVKEAVKAVDIRDITTGEIIDKYPYELSFGDNDIDIFNRTADATFNITDNRFVIGNSEAKKLQLGRQNFTFTDNGTEYTVSDRELKLADGASTEAVIKVNPDDDVLTRLGLAKNYALRCIDMEPDTSVEVKVVSSDANGSTIAVSLMKNGNNEVLSSEKTTRLEFNITYQERKAIDLKIEPSDVTDNVVYVMPDDDLNARIALGTERVKEMFTVTGAEELSEDDYIVNIQPYNEGNEDETLFLITISLTNDDYCFKSKEHTAESKTIIFTEKKPAMVSLSTFNSVTPVLSTDISDTNKDREAILKEYIKKNITIAPAPASDKEMCTDYDLDDIEYTTEYSDNGLPASMTAKVVLHPDDYAEDGYNYSLTFTPTWEIEADTTLALKADATLTPELRIPLADMTDVTIDDAIVDYMKNAFNIINGFEGCGVKITPTVTGGDQVEGEVRLILPEDGSNYYYKTKPGCITTLSFDAKVIGVSSATLALKDGMTLSPVIEVKETDDALSRIALAYNYINDAYTVENADCDYEVKKYHVASMDSGRVELTLTVPDGYELSEDSVNTLIFNAKYKVIYDYAKPEITKVTPAAKTVGVNWSEVRGAEKYRVYYFADGKWTYAGERTELGMYVRNLTSGKKYGFAVKAYVDGQFTDVTSSDIVYVTAE